MTQCEGDLENYDPCDQEGVIEARTPEGDRVNLCYEHFRQNENLQLSKMVGEEFEGDPYVGA
jgi:hypothetical protein